MDPLTHLTADAYSPPVHTIIVVSHSGVTLGWIPCSAWVQAAAGSGGGEAGLVTISAVSGQPPQQHINLAVPVRWSGALGLLCSSSPSPGKGVEGIRLARWKVAGASLIPAALPGK